MSSELILPCIVNGASNEKFQFEDKVPVMEDLFQIAEKELREDETTRSQCLQHLKGWIAQNPDIVNCITDNNFLLRFLRTKKFSIPMAEQMLLKYLNFRKRFSHIMYNMDFLDPVVTQLINSGYIYASPFRDKNGRRVILYNLHVLNGNKYTSADIYKTHVITYETILAEEESQIMGINHIGDCAGGSPSLVTLFSVTEFATLIRWGEQSFPMMHKNVSVLNLPTALKYVYDFAKSNMSQKLKDRFTIHDSISDLQKKVDKHCLPAELGGVMPMAEMIKLWKAELESKRERLLSFDKMNLLSDRGIIRRKNTPSHDDTGIGSLPGSFRKLEVD